jgi:hypothetical protein
MEGKEIQPATCSTASPDTPAQQPDWKVGPEVLPARKTLAIAIEAPKEPPSGEPPPRASAQTIASVSPKGRNPSDNPAKTQAPNVEDRSKPRTESPRTDDMEGPTSAFQPERILHHYVPRDLWYILATVFGAVFTYILAPVVVEIIKGRLARHHRQVPLH